jgi:spermidine synthase
MAKDTGREKKSPQKGIDRSIGLFALILGCFFVSGFTGLIYEILWTRMIVKIIGSSPFAVSIVLTVFMGGLGLGSYLAGRTIDRVNEPSRLVRIYGALELGIGAYGLALPLLLAAFKPVYAALYNGLFEHFFLYNVLTFAGCALLLIVPVTCMGATLPILARFFVTSLSGIGTRVGRLYGLNTIGAAAGSLLCGFWLIDVMGVWGTLVVAVVLNGTIGAICFLASARLGRHAAAAKPAAAPSSAAARGEAPAANQTGETASAFGSYALVVFAVSGFCAMAYEVIWIKLLGLVVGPTTYSFTIVLVTFITALALGAIFFGWLGDRVKNTIGLLLATQIAAALFSLLFSQFAGTSQIFFAKLIYEFKESLASLYMVKAAVLFVCMFPATFCLGATFPLVGKICTTSLSRTGRSIGFAYAVNSVGAVLGSFCAGFVLIPLAGKENGLRLVIALQLLTALFVGIRVFRRSRAPVVRWTAAALAVVVAAGLVIRYPHWNRKMLSRGKYQYADRIELRQVGWARSLSPGSVEFAEEEGEELVYYGDGIGGFTAVLIQDVLGDTRHVLLNSGKPDASFPGDMATQVLFAHFPMLFHPDPKNVLIVGLASGITAGEVLHYPVDRVDVVDINDKVPAASAYFREWNSDVLANPRTRLIIQDARAHLAMTKQKYDVISSEPSNPWMAGISSLFTRDFFESARDHLNDGGIFVQFAHGYSMDWNVFSMIGRTFADVFPNSILVNTDPTSRGGDYLLIGTKGEEKMDANVAAKRLAYAQRSKNIVLLDHRLFFNMILSEDLERLFGDGPVHTENRPRLEFAAPRLLYTNDPSIRQRIAEKSFLSDGTRAIVRRNTADVDAQIDFAAYALSVYRPAFAFQNNVNLSAATAEQRERFSGLLADYCGKNADRGVFSLRDREIRDRCASAQMRTLEARMAGAKDKTPFLKRLGEMYSNWGESDRAAECYAEALSLNPDDAETRTSLGVVLTSQGKFSEAVEQHRQAIRIAPDSPHAYNNLGGTFARQGKLAEALTCFSEALKRDPDFADAHFNMGNALAAQGYLDQAAEHFAAAIRLKPDFAEAYNNLGNAFLSRGRFDDAIAQYSAALRIQPDYALAQYGLGSALASQGRTREAIEHLARAVELSPDYTEALSGLAWMLATDGDARLRDGVRAVRLAERAREAAGGDNPLILDTLAAAYAETGEYERAAETARRAAELARSAGGSEWAQEIEKRAELYARGLPFRTAAE